MGRVPDATNARRCGPIALHAPRLLSPLALLHRRALFALSQTRQSTGIFAQKRQPLRSNHFNYIEYP